VTVVATMVLAAIYFAGSAVLGSAMLFPLAIGAACVGYGVLTAHSKSFMPPALVGRGVTLMNFFSIGGVALMQMITGALVTATADPADPVRAYHYLFGFYALVLAAALAVYLFSRDARPRGSDRPAAL